MRSLYDFIIEPVGERYTNTSKVNGKDLVLNTKIESFKFVNRTAKVIETPLAFETKIKKGDTIVVHQNIFRRFYNMKGEQQSSRASFKDNLYFATLEQIYLYKNKNDWKSINDRCFIKPLKNTDEFSTQKEQSCIGILKIGNNTLKGIEINPGDKVGFKPGGEWEFIINSERVYCMKSNDIVIKYEYQGNEEDIIQAGHKAVEELIKVAKEAIVDSNTDISADRLKNAAATKKLAIFDAFEILNRIEEEKNLLEDKPKVEEKKEKSFRGFAEKRSK